MHVRDGWVHLSEGAFPEFIGWVMELYGQEGCAPLTSSSIFQDADESLQIA
jgi:hypothetical protein